MVPGIGPQPSLGMIVGEAPGFQEVEAGEPFVGRAGKLLMTALRSFGIARDSVFITNVVKEIPLDGEGRIRRPYEVEIEAWRPFLELEVQNTSPAAILALGRTAAVALASSDDQIPFGSKIGNVYTAWHPAYLLRGGGGEDAQHTWLEQIEPWAEAIR